MKIDPAERVLMVIGNIAHCSVEQARTYGSKGTLTRLERDGLIQRDPEWTGCLALTEAGERAYGLLIGDRA